MSTKTDNTQSQIQYVTVSPDTFSQTNQFSHDDDIDLRELWNALVQGKFIILLVTAFFAFASLIYVINQPNVYKASVLLAPAQGENSAGLSALAGQFGGLANIAGISLGGVGVDKTTLALETLKSQSFLEAFIDKHDLSVLLMASKGWDESSDTMIIDDSVYNVENKYWLGESESTLKNEPSAWKRYKSFSKLFSVSKNNESGFITIELSFFSPTLAKKWLGYLVTDINEVMRKQDQREAEDSIQYLTQQLEQTTVSSMQTVFYQLIEEQTKNIMLTNVSKEYVLKTIGAVQVPEIKDKPKRALICILITFLGVTVGCFWVLVRYYSRKD